MSGYFSDKTFRFLRSLARNNNREWFLAHKPDYEAHVRQPMTAIVERLARELQERHGEQAQV